MQSLKLTNLEKIKSAQTPHALWATVSNDEFVPVQMYYGAFYNASLDPYDKSDEGGAKLRRLGEQLEHMINWLNTEVWWDKLGGAIDSNKMSPVSNVPAVAKRLEELKGQNESTRRPLLYLLLELDAAVYTKKAKVNELLSLR